MNADNPSLTVADWNWAVLMLGQALVGSVSPNFRQVQLGFEDGLWIIRLTLWEEQGSDRDEAEEICDQFSISLADIRDQLSPAAYTDAKVEVVVERGALKWPDSSSARNVFRMRV